MDKMKLPTELVSITLTKLVHGGQALGELSDGRKAFVWNALPDEEVRARIIRQKRSYVEAIAETVTVASPDRQEPAEVNYLATSPWQMMSFEAENRYKKNIVENEFAHQGVRLPAVPVTIHGTEPWHYRNKMEYSFWGDDSGLHLALHQRGSHGKQIVTGSKLALPAVDQAARDICAQLDTLSVRAGDLKTIVVRCSQVGAAVASLFVKPQTFTRLELPASLQGLRVYHSNPKSPASVPTRLLYELGTVTLQDELLDKSFTYDVDSFFQVNVPVFERALERIKSVCGAEHIVDMYAGVGSIGLTVAQRSVELVELHPATAAMARLNAAARGLQATVTEASTENAIQSIVADCPVIFDPPRAGLHRTVVERCLEVRPPQIIYLSCNPATQARDLALLQIVYDVTQFEVYNFFPRTPHIETLAVLKCRE